MSSAFQQRRVPDRFFVQSLSNLLGIPVMANQASQSVFHQQPRWILARLLNICLWPKTTYSVRPHAIQILQTTTLSKRSCQCRLSFWLPKLESYRIDVGYILLRKLRAVFWMVCIAGNSTSLPLAVRFVAAFNWKIDYLMLLRKG